MGVIISARDFTEDNNSGLLKPIFYCHSIDKISNNAVSINVLLAKKLLDCSPSRRTIKIESLFNQVLSQLPNNAIIKDFDVMFNPDYKIDVIKIMTVACKSKPFSVLWPGKCENGKIFYGEEGYPDFKSFNIDDYDITCII